MATNKVPSLCKQPDCMKSIFCYGEEFITDLIMSTDLDPADKQIIQITNRYLYQGVLGLVLTFQ